MNIATLVGNRSLSMNLIMRVTTNIIVEQVKRTARSYVNLFRPKATL